MHRFALTCHATALGLLTATAALAQAASAPAAAASAAHDPYLWLEKVDDPKAMDWVRAENGKTLKALEADPRFPEYDKQALALAQTHDRIPIAAQIDGGLWNFWQDADHVRGIWRV